MTDVLFSMQPKTRSGFHFGGRIVFDQAGFVYLTLGDRGDKDRATMLVRSFACTTMGVCPPTTPLLKGQAHSLKNGR
jgi:glucose/arabinose dehydrogenase